MDRKAHWEDIYLKKAPTEVSWFQAVPATSLKLIASTNLGKEGKIIDIGGGDSVLVDHLLADGFQHVTVLDISAAALERAKERLGARAARVTWIEADVTDVTLPGSFDLWHDRAVFHFLTDTEDRKRYIRTASGALHAGAHLIIATFALTGPPRCSGLEVARYGPETLQRELGDGFDVVETFEETHATPWQAEQRFLYARLKKR